jgi:hypothetical protein
LIGGNWNLQTVLMNGDTLNDPLQFNVIPKYTYYSFFYGNSLNVRTYAMNQITESANGEYRLKKNSKLYMRFNLHFKSYEINAKIKKLNRTELYIEYEDNGNKYYLKLFSY